MKCFQISCIEHIDMKIARPHELAKVINYRLIEDHSQKFNEGLCHTVSFILYAFEKSANFPFKVDIYAKC